MQEVAGNLVTEEGLALTAVNHKTKTLQQSQSGPKYAKHWSAISTALARHLCGSHILLERKPVAVMLLI